MTGILISEFGMWRLYVATQGTLRWDTTRVFSEPETRVLPRYLAPLCNRAREESLGHRAEHFHSKNLTRLLC